MRTRFILGAIVLLTACSGSSELVAPPGEVPPPTVRTTLAFGDPPVEGALILEPRSPVIARNAWNYVIDLDGDGEGDASGTIDRRVDIPYRFQAAGEHEIEIVLIRGNERLEMREPVIVNDHSTIQVLGQAHLPFNYFEAFLTGIAVDRMDDHVYVAVASAVPPSVFEIDAATMEVRERYALDQLTANLQALSVPSDEDLLYVLGRFEMGVFSLPEVEPLSIIDLADVRAELHLEAIPGGRAYVSDRGLGLVEASNGAVVAQLKPGKDFELSPDTASIALLRTEDGENYEVLLLEAEQLSVQWRINLTAADPPDLPSGSVTRATAIAFSADGGKIYVMQAVQDGRWDFLLLDAQDGRLVRRMTIGFGCTTIHCWGLANPVAISADGRFAVFPTGIGAFFIDRTRNLPLYRTQVPDDFLSEAGEIDYCCSVAASRIANEFYFSGFYTRNVTKVRLDN